MTTKLFKLKNSFEENYVALKQLYPQHQQLISTILQELSTPFNVREAMHSNIQKRLQVYYEEQEQIKSMLHTTSVENKFWNINEKLELELEDKFKKVKAIESDIESISDIELTLCSKVEEVQKTIRLILNIKENRNRQITKAEPYYRQKESLTQEIRTLKQQKEVLKAHRLKQIKVVLVVLDKLKLHREQRLKGSRSTNVKISTCQSLISDLISNLEWFDSFGKGKKTSIIEANIGTISKIQKQVGNLFDQICRLIQEQNSIIKSTEMQVNKQAEGSYLWAKIEPFLGQITPSMAIKRIKAVVQREKESSKSKEELEKGLAITNETISTLESILRKIQSDNQRKIALLQEISTLQAKYNVHSKCWEQVESLEDASEALVCSKNKMELGLDMKADEADVEGYKAITAKMEATELEKKKVEDELAAMRKKYNSNAQMLYNEAQMLQQKYSDVFAEVLPQVWLRDNDFSKEETIKDLHLYLVKIFKQMNIVD